MSIGKNSIARAALTTQKDTKQKSLPKKETKLLQVETALIKYVKGYSKKSEAGKELVSSIKTRGIVQPLLVALTDDGKFYLIDGNLRLEAAKKLEIKTVPAIAIPVDDASNAGTLYKELRATSKIVKIKEKPSKPQSKEPASVKRAVREVPYYLL